MIQSFAKQQQNGKNCRHKGKNWPGKGKAKFTNGYLQNKYSKFKRMTGNLKARKNATWEIDLHLPRRINWGFTTEHELAIISMRNGDLELKGHTTITAAKDPCEILSHTPKKRSLAHSSV